MIGHRPIRLRLSDAEEMEQGGIPVVAPTEVVVVLMLKQQIYLIVLVHRKHFRLVLPGLVEKQHSLKMALL